MYGYLVTEMSSVQELPHRLHLPYSDHKLPVYPHSPETLQGVAGTELSC